MAVIRGMGALSALGAGVGPLAQALDTGDDGIRPVRRFATAAFGARIAGLVPAYDDQRYRGGAMANRLCPGFACAAIREAMAAAGLSVFPPRSLLVMGASQVDSTSPVHELVEATVKELAFPGAALTISTACSSSAAAIGVGVAALRLGLADLVIVGGADVLVPELFGGFDSMGLLTTEKCTPFGVRFGTTLGEGAGFVVLERASAGETATRVAGYGLSCDAWHETAPHPQGEGLAAAIAACLQSAGLSGAEVDYVNAHGTGTAPNDVAEVQAIQAALGRTPAFSSSKGTLGHAQAAAGVLETITTVLAMEKGVLPPSLRASPRRERVPDGLVEAPRAGTVEVALSNSAAFGGANAVVAVSRHRPSPTPHRHAVYWLGGSACGRHGTGLARLHEALDDAEAPTSTALPSLRGLRVDPRTLDPAGTLLVRAVADALAEAGVSVGRENRDRVGLIGGAVNVSPSTHETFQASIRARGIGHPSAPAFARMVLNAPAGAAARALGLRGAHTMLSTGPGTGLAAVVLAATLLADNGPTTTLVAGAVDEADPAGANGAAAAVLGRTPGAIRVSAWAWAATPEEAEAQVLDAPGGPLRPDYRDTPAHPAPLFGVGNGPAVDGVHRVLRAVRALERGARTALVVEAGGLSASAILFSLESPS